LKYPRDLAMEKVTEAIQKVAIGGGDKKAKKEKKAPAAAAADASAGPLELQPPAAFLQERIELFDRLYKEQQEELASRPRDDILITMPDGTVKSGKAYETTPAEIAKGISNSLLKRTVVARIDGETLWDLERPLEKSCKLELLDFSDEQGKFVFCTELNKDTRVDRTGADRGLFRAFECAYPRRGLRAEVRLLVVHRSP
jgi:threonyl-tRNA synthetase